MFRSAPNILIFLIGFLAATFSISFRAPLRDVPIVTEKLQRFAASGHEFDTLVIGTSMTYRQLDPAQFDKLTAQAGKPTRTYNLGVNSMRPPEDTFVLERALASNTSPLRYVLVECNAVQPVLAENYRGTMRGEYWHDLRRMKVIYEALSSELRKSRKRADYSQRRATAAGVFFEHIPYWMRNTLRIGQLNERLVYKALGLPGPDLCGARMDGFKPGATNAGLEGEARRKYEALLSAQLAKPSPFYTDAPGNAELLAKQALIESRGAKLILFIPPHFAPRYWVPDSKLNIPVLDFSAPSKHLELFAPQHRSDTAHTNPKGSELYTAKFAGEFLLVAE